MIDNNIWIGPLTELDRDGEPTGYEFVRCKWCGCEVLVDGIKHCTHRDGCPVELPSSHIGGSGFSFVRGP